MDKKKEEFCCFLEDDKDAEVLSESDWVQRRCAHGRDVCLFVQLLVELPNHSTEEDTERGFEKSKKKRQRGG